MNILALDLGKYKTVFCEYNSANSEHNFGKINTTPQDMHDMFVDKDPDRVVMEICSVAGWIVDIAKALGIDTEVANTTHDAWRWKNVKKKNDREDALKLAKLSAMNQLPKVHIPIKAVREHRALIKYRQRLVRQRIGIKNAIRAIFTAQGMPMLKGKGLWSKGGLQWLKQHTKPLDKITNVNELWRGRLNIELQVLSSISKAIRKVEERLDKIGVSDARIQKLQTIGGVGPRLSETVVAFLDDPRRFRNIKHVGSYAGLAPRQYQSGQIEHQGKTSGQGNKLLRNLLVEICWMSLRVNPWARATYRRLLRGSSSRSKIAITALARQLLVKCWIMLRDMQDIHDSTAREAVCSK